MRSGKRKNKNEVNVIIDGGGQKIIQKISFDRKAEQLIEVHDPKELNDIEFME